MTSPITSRGAGTSGKTSEDPDSRPGLYVHVPFCHSECTYCDFYRVGYRDAAAIRFLRALEIEISGLPEGFRARTVYIGGGTPSALREAELEGLVDLLAPLAGGCLEWTVEVNPKSATERKIDILSAYGVDRVSFGAQTFRDDALEILGRRHRAADILRAFRLIERRIPAVSFDLIFALPGETLEEWIGDLEAALALSPAHLSAYSLIHEPGTPLTRMIESGELHSPGEEVERAMFLEARTRLQAAGYEHYEVSSYARPGRRSLHNQGYWEGRDYVGLGPGAASTLGRRRYTNSPDLEAYCRLLEAHGEAPREEEELSEENRLVELVLLGLRTSDGLSLAEFRDRARLDFAAWSAGRSRVLVAQGFLEERGGALRLTDEGLPVADAVISFLVASRPTAS